MLKLINGNKRAARRENARKPERWMCCEAFSHAEENELVCLTTEGFVVCGEQVDEDSFEIVDIFFCPFCATRLPAVK